MHPTSARASSRPIRWALRVLRDPSLIEGAGTDSGAGARGCDDASRARCMTWLLCGRSG